MTVRPKPADVREACVAEAFRIVEEAGVESLSLRDVARRLGVSHQAPYKHFPSRGHMLAEIIARSFDDFSAFLQSRPLENEPKADLQAMGSLYMAYARQHPLQYRLMFNTPMPDPGQHPEMMEKARFAFGILRDRLAQMPLRPVPGAQPSPELDALFVWSALHGLASLLQSDVFETLGLSEAEGALSVEHCFARIDLALGA